MSIGDAFGAIAMKAVENMGAPDEMYLNEDDGLLYCKRCHTARQMRLNFKELNLEFLGDGERIVSVRCRCQAQADEAEKEAERLAAIHEKADINNRITLRNDTIRKLLETRKFSLADDGSERIEQLALFVEKFDEHKADNIGLMLYGTFGNGKTFGACCVANALMERHRTVAFTTPAMYLSLSFEERQEYLRRLPLYELLILDDLGAQRENEFSLEQLYNLIDSRGKSGLPMIITTNIMPSEMANETDRDLARIYERVKELCIPVQYKGESRRAAIRKQKMEKFKNFFE